jgi:hypothetical protein
MGRSRYDESNGWTDGYIDRWLDDPSKEHVSILGEFGTGKTWFALHYAWTVAKRYREAKERGVERPRLPLFIPLRDYAKAVSVESLFSEFFFRRHEIPLPGYSAFEQLNRMGKLLLIFDGFDEMAARVDRQKMINNFWELARVVVPGSKAILTCRTEHFPEAKEGRALLSAELQASTAKLTGEAPQFEVIELEKFDDNQVRQVLSYRSSPSTVSQIVNNPQLLDLARRPIMSELILDALPDIEAGKPVDLSRIYLYAVRRKMERDIKAERTFTSLADKLYFLCEISWEMLSTDQMTLNYRHLPDRIRRLFGSVVLEQKDLDHWHYDMMAQTMLIRNSDGDYFPAHRSLIEFFSAYKFAAETGALREDFLEMAQRQTAIDTEKQSRNYRWSDYFLRERDKDNKVIPIASLRKFIPESMQQLMTTFGSQSLAEPAVILMAPMVHTGPLWAIVEATRECGIEEAAYLGGNAVTILARLGELAGSNLAGTILKAANLDRADLTRTVFRKAFLQEARMVGAVACEADFSDSDLGNAILSSGNLSKAIMRGSNLRRARMRATNLEGADFRGADLTDAEVKNVNLRGAILDDIDLSTARLVGRSVVTLPAEILVEILRKRSGKTRQQLLKEVAKAKINTPQIHDLLLSMVDDPDPLVRADAIKVYANFWGPDFPEGIVLRRMTDDPDPRVRAAAAMVFGIRRENLFNDFVNSLSADPAPEVRLSLTKVISRMRSIKHIELLRRMLLDVDERVRCSAILGLSKVPGIDSIEDIEDLIKREQSYKVRKIALRELNKIKRGDER